MNAALVLVSMPSAGYSHFYVVLASVGGAVFFIIVSMPSAGYSHFYIDYGAILHGLSGVNALGGLFSFLLYLAVTEWLGDQGVNALGGLFSFLPTWYVQVTELCEQCVNALGGLFSFLLG